MAHTTGSSSPLLPFQRPPMARNPINRSQPHPRRKAPSRKSSHMVYCESGLEDDGLLRFEACPSVVSARAQPRKVSRLVGGRERPSTPDFELGLSNGQIILVEVKHSQQANRPDVAEKLVATAAAAHQLGYHYYVVTERWIRFHPLLENLRLLSRWRSTAAVSGYSPLLDDVRGALPLPFCEVARRLGSRAIAAAYVLAGRLHMNLLEELSEDSAVLPEPHCATAIVLNLPWHTKRGIEIWGGAQ